MEFSFSGNTRPIFRFDFFSDFEKVSRAAPQNSLAVNETKNGNGFFYFTGSQPCHPFDDVVDHSRVTAGSHAWRTGTGSTIR